MYRSKDPETRSRFLNYRSIIFLQRKIVEYSIFFDDRILSHPSNRVQCTVLTLCLVPGLGNERLKKGMTSVWVVVTV